jgi:hypothetical protein
MKYLVLLLALAACGGPSGTTTTHLRSVRDIGNQIEFWAQPQGDPLPCAPHGLTLNPSFTEYDVPVNGSVGVQITSCNTSYGDHIIVAARAFGSRAPVAIGTGGSGASNPDGGDFALMGLKIGSTFVDVHNQTSGAVTSIRVVVNAGL